MTADQAEDEPSRSERTRNAEQPAVDLAETAPGHSVAAAQDTVERDVSAGRRPPSSPVDAVAAEKPVELSSARIAAIRKRLLSGAYGTAEVADEVARRMLERRDIS